jgi:hypothetical protein
VGSGGCSCRLQGRYSYTSWGDVIREELIWNFHRSAVILHIAFVTIGRGICMMWDPLLFGHQFDFPNECDSIIRD